MTEDRPESDREVTEKMRITVELFSTLNVINIARKIHRDKNQLSIIEKDY